MKYWNIIRPFLPGILLGAGFMAFILIFKPSIYLLLGIVTFITVVFGVRSGVRGAELLRNVLTNNAILLLIYVAWRFLGGYGLIGLTAAIGLVVAVILVRQRKLFINTIREIETIIWGKTHEEQQEEKKRGFK